MARRQTTVLRNLDDPLRVLGFLSLRSCGLVLVFFAALHSLEALLGVMSLLAGSWAFLAEIGATGLLAVGLSIAERTDDEHLVPSAIRYYLSRPHAVLYSGGRAEHDRGHRLEHILDASRGR
jgi:hypothetical protein